MDHRSDQGEAGRGVTPTDLYEQHQTELHRYALRLVRDPDRADDLVQETFVRALGHLGLLGLLKPYQRRAWLYQTTKNLFIDEEQARRRQQALAEQLAWDGALTGDPYEEVMPLNPLALVPERYRDMVVKRYVLGMTSQEIAKELGIPAATVRWRLHAATRLVRSQRRESRFRQPPEYP